MALARAAVGLSWGVASETSSLRAGRFTDPRRIPWPRERFLRAQIIGINVSDHFWTAGVSERGNNRYGLVQNLKRWMSPFRKIHRKTDNSPSRAVLSKPLWYEKRGNQELLENHGDPIAEIT